MEQVAPDCVYHKITVTPEYDRHFESNNQQEIHVIMLTLVLICKTDFYRAKCIMLVANYDFIKRAKTELINIMFS